MKGLSGLTQSLGRSTSSKQNKRPSILPENRAVTEPTVSAQPPSTEDAANKTPTANAGEDLFAMCDVLTRPPSQDIIRPFDNFTARPSDSKSLSKRKNRLSLVGNTPPTVDSLETAFTPFGDAFKSFVQEPAPKPWLAASDGATPSLTSGTTLDTSPEDAAVHSATPRSAVSPIPSKPSTSYFKRFKSRVSSYLTPGTAGEAGEQIAVKPVAAAPATPKASENATPKIVVAGAMNSYTEKNSSNTSLGLAGSIRRLGRRSRESRDSTSDAEKDKSTTKKAEEEPKVSLEPPASPGAVVGEDGQAARRYGHGVLLHPIVEEDK